MIERAGKTAEKTILLVSEMNLSENIFVQNIAIHLEHLIPVMKQIVDVAFRNESSEIFFSITEKILPTQSFGERLRFNYKLSEKNSTEML
ncbi:MAG: hypothetical protein LBU34_03800 [Planctomycetaceae bacterium]|nr:hypothetical protein [Planctomycetaceae bacterium]